MTAPTCSHTDALRTFAALVREMKAAQKAVAEFRYKDGWGDGLTAREEGAKCGIDWQDSEAKKRLEGMG